MNIFGVSPEKGAALRERMERVGIREADLRESFIRSSGSGGQRLNKVSTSVYLRHLPSGLEVKCGRTRFQGLNRYYARLLLVGKMEALVLGRRSEAAAEMYRARRRKQRRSRRARQAIRRDKEKRSARKLFRAPVDTPSGE